MKIEITGYEGLPAGEYAADMRVELDRWRMEVQPDRAVEGAPYTVVLS